MKPKAWQIALAGYWLLLLVATHLPHDAAPAPQEGVDKGVHFAAFAALAILFAATWQRTTGRLALRHLLWIWLAISLYAALDEWTQSFFGRYSSATDWLADVIGAAVGLAMLAVLHSRRETSDSS